MWQPVTSAGGNPPPSDEYRTARAAFHGEGKQKESSINYKLIVLGAYNFAILIHNRNITYVLIPRFIPETLGRRSYI